MSDETAAWLDVDRRSEMRAAAAAVLVLVLALPAAAASPRRAALELESLAPLVIRGKHFGAREAIILTYAGTGTKRRATGIRSTRRGSFRHVFDVRLGPCAAFTVRAAGFRGSRAVLQVDPGCKKREGPPKRALAVTLAQPTS
jgi:hypothetical protein